MASHKLRFVAKPSITEFTPLLPIRPLTAMDKDKVAALMHEAYTVWFGSDRPHKPSLEESTVFVKSFFDSSIYPEASLVCGPPDKIVSALLVSRPEPNTFPGIKEVFTHPLYRSRGLATTLITQCLNLLAESGQPGLEALVDPKDDRMIRILKKLGFAETSMP